MKRTSWAGPRVGLLLAVLGAALAGCGGGDLAGERLSQVGETCSKTGDFEAGLVCLAAVCQQEGALCPDDQECSGLECGPDPVCGESCGSCDSDETCQNGQCVNLSSEDTYSPPTGGTWKDPTSGLTWQVSPPTGTYEWDDAKSYCNSLSLGNKSGWRLPTIEELRTLIRGCPATESAGSCNVAEGDCLAWSCRDEPCYGCSYEDGPGEGGMYWPDEIAGDCCWYWSSSPVEDNDADAWVVGFNSGLVYGNRVYDGMPVRCVR